MNSLPKPIPSELDDDVGPSSLPVLSSDKSFKSRVTIARWFKVSVVSFSKCNRSAENGSDSLILELVETILSSKSILLLTNGLSGLLGSTDMAAVVTSSGAPCSVPLFAFIEFDRCMPLVAKLTSLEAEVSLVMDMFSKAT
uniref:Uncharacterized protein n=1 Tax=Arundo donax TaxID=35708 RepID=A0A0A9BQ71_ARUDO